MPATISLMAACARSSAWTISSSETSFEPASTITMASLLPATIRSRRLRRRCSNVGLIRNSPSISPTRTPAMLRVNGTLGDREGRRGAGDGQHVAVVLDVGGEHERDDLRLVAPSGGEERPDRAIDEPAREHFLLARLAFALEETAGNPAGRVRVLTVVDRQRQEIDAFARVRRGTGGHEDHGVARANDNGAVGLLGQPARLDRQRLSPDSDVACMHVSVFH